MVRLTLESMKKNYDGLIWNISITKSTSTISIRDFSENRCDLCSELLRQGDSPLREVGQWNLHVVNNVFVIGFGIIYAG